VISGRIWPKHLIHSEEMLLRLFSTKTLTSTETHHCSFNKQE